jgi:hypothetical protein
MDLMSKLPKSFPSVFAPRGKQPRWIFEVPRCTNHSVTKVTASGCFWLSAVYIPRSARRLADLSDLFRKTCFGGGVVNVTFESEGQLSEIERDRFWHFFSMKSISIPILSDNLVMTASLVVRQC